MNPDFIIKILGLPPDVSKHGAQIDLLMFWVHLLMVVLFIGWGIFFIYVLLRFNKRKNPTADYHGVKNHFSNYIEIAVAVVEVVLLVGLSIPFWAKVVNALPAEKDSTVVRIVAEQFAWNVHYPGPDGIFGKTSPSLMNSQNNPLGLDRSDPAAADDVVTINQLHLPVNKPAIIYLSSKDVVHCFALPLLRVKQDIIPGMSIPTWFEPIKTGNFEIACAQLCGLGHYRMKGYLTIHTPEDYAAWLAAQAATATSAPKADDFWN